MNRPCRSLTAMLTWLGGLLAFVGVVSGQSQSDPGHYARRYCDLCPFAESRYFEPGPAATRPNPPSTSQPSPREPLAQPPLDLGVTFFNSILPLQVGGYFPVTIPWHAGPSADATDHTACPFSAQDEGSQEIASIDHKPTQSAVTALQPQPVVIEVAADAAQDSLAAEAIGSEESDLESAELEQADGYDFLYDYRYDDDYHYDDPAPEAAESDAQTVANPLGDPHAEATAEDGTSANQLEVADPSVLDGDYDYESGYEYGYVEPFELEAIELAVDQTAAPGRQAATPNPTPKAAEVAPTAQATEACRSIHDPQYDQIVYGDRSGLALQDLKAWGTELGRLGRGIWQAAPLPRIAGTWTRLQQQWDGFIARSGLEWYWMDWKDQWAARQFESPRQIAADPLAADELDPPPVPPELPTAAELAAIQQDQPLCDWAECPMVHELGLDDVRLDPTLDAQTETSDGSMVASVSATTESMTREVVRSAAKQLESWGDALLSLSAELQRWSEPRLAEAPTQESTR